MSNINCDNCVLNCKNSIYCYFNIIIEDFEDLINGTSGKEKIRFIADT